MEEACATLTRLVMYAYFDITINLVSVTTSEELVYYHCTYTALLEKNNV